MDKDYKSINQKKIRNRKNYRDYMKYKTSKKGISLVVLVIIIIVMIILASVTVISTKNAIDSGNISSIASDLKEIEDATESYYLTNNEMPTPDDSKDSINKEVLVSLSGTDNTNALNNELDINGDSVAEFYQIDLKKINVTNTSRGTKAKGQNDVFYVAYPSMDVYYVRGVKAKGDIFFSLSSKISKYTKIGTNSTVNTSTTEVLYSNGSGVKSGLEVTREKSWTSTMPLTIKTYINSDETLFLSISSGTEKQIVTSEGQFIQNFALVGLFKANTILADGATFKKEDILSDKKYAEIIKKKGTNEIARLKIDLSNFDTAVPTVSNISTASYTNMNTVMFDVSDDLSSIKSIRYDYLTKIDTDGTEKPYYSGVSSFDVEYMKTKSKRAKILKDQGTIILNLPKNVNQVSYLVEDMAGNYILQGTRVIPFIYISTILENLTDTSFSITSNIYSTNGISNVKYSYSTDGVNYIGEQSFDLNTDSVTTTKSVPFTGSDFTKPFLKTIVTDNNSIVANRKVETDIYVADPSKLVKTNIANAPALVTGMTPIKWNNNTGNPVITNAGDSTWYDYTQGKWANAQTADGSYWVWIPRYEYKITSGYHSSTPGTIDVKFIPVTQKAADNGYILHPAFNFGGTELSGIWVAKFEATAREGVANTIAGDNVTSKHVKVVPGVQSWRYNYISTAYTVCRNMEADSTYGWSSSGIDTHLMKNIEWGAVAYLSRSTKYGIADGTEVWINPNSSYITGQAGSGTSVSSTTSTDTYNTGNGPMASTTHNVYGVYDMSGGSWEYVAAYVNNGHSYLTTYGASLVSAAEKYKDVYAVGSNDDYETNYNANSSKVGDAVYETSSSYSGATSWFGDYSYMPYSSAPFFKRGGYCYDGTYAGVFGFNYTNGSVDSHYGFRPVLAAFDPSLDTETFESSTTLFNYSGDWLRTTTNPYEGSYCYTNKDITSSQTSSTEFTIDNSYGEAYLTFYYKVSSESGYDKFNIYKNGTLLNAYSGEIGYTYYQIQLDSGANTIKFEYKKDGSVDNGTDSVYVDNIQLIT